MNAERARSEKNYRRAVAAATMMTWAWRTVITLACLTLVLVIAAATRSEPMEAPPPPDPARPEDNIVQTVGLSPEELAEALRQRTRECLCNMGPSSLADLRQATHDAIEADFRPIYNRRIPRFLDDHYSVIGQYVELGQAAIGEAQRAITRRIYGDLDARITKRFDNATEAWNTEVNTLTTRCADDQLKALDADEETRRLQARMLEATIPETVGRFTSSAPIASLGSIGGGLAGALAVKALTKKLLTAIAAKTIGKMAGKSAGTLGTVAAGAGLGSFLGPIGTAVGGIAGGVVGWFAVDAAAVNIDEYMTRDDLEKDLIALVDERKRTIMEAASRGIDTRLQAFERVCTP